MMSRTIRVAAMAVTVLMVGSMFFGSGVAQQPPQLTEEEKQRFLDTWLPRLNDEPYMTAYLNSPDPEWDGFDHYLEADKVQLVYTLVDAFAAANATMMGFLTDPALTPENQEMRKNISVGILYQAIFDKPELTKLLAPLKEANQEKPDGGEATTDVGQSEYFAGMTFEDITKHFQDQQSTNAQGSPVPETTLPDPAALPTLDEATATAGQQPPEVAKYLQLEDVQPGTVVALDVPTLPSVPTELLEVPALEVPDLPVELPAVEAPAEVLLTVQDLLNFALSTATYRICWSYAGGAIACTVVAVNIPALPSELQALGLPVPDLPDQEVETFGVLGAPTPVDVTGDGVPDITVTLAAAPILDAENLQPGVQVLFRVERIDVLGGTMPLEIVAHYQVPGAPQVPATERPYAVLGFESADMPRLSALTASISDLLTPEVDLGVALTTGDARQPLTLIGGTYNVRLAGDDYEPYDPTIAQVTLTPTPDTLSLDLDQDHQAVLEGGQSTLARVLDLGATTSVATRVDLAFVAQTGDAADVIVASIDRLPVEVNARISTTPATATLDYEASGVIGEVRAALFDIPDVDDLSVFEAQVVTLEDLPAELHLETRDEAGTQTIAYDASGSVAQATFIALETAAGQALPVEYLGLTAQGLPEALDLVKDDRTVTLDASAPIGQVAFLRFEGAGTPVRLAGDHLLDLTRVTNGARFELTSAQISGLQSASVAIDGATARAELGLVGGQAFTAMLVDEAVDGASTARHMLAARVSNLPSRITITVSEGHLQYEASAVVEQLLVAIEDRASGPTGEKSQVVQVAVDDLPASIDLQFALQGNSLRYAASSRLAGIAVSIEERDTARAKGTTVLSQVRDLPREARINWDNARQQLFYETSERLGLIEAAIITRDGAATSLIYAQATDLPTRIVAGLGGDTVVIDADTPVGSIAFAASNYVGWRALAGDHALMVDDGAQRSLSARISGIQRAAIDLRNQQVTLDFQGGQAFTAAFADPGRLGAVLVSNVPRRVSVELGEQAITYRASDRIQTVQGFFCEGIIDVAALACRTADRLGLVRLTDVPTEIRINLARTGTVEAAVTMDGPLGRLEAGYSERGFIPALAGGDYLVVLDGARRAIGARITGFEGLSVELQGTHLELQMQSGTPLTALLLRDNGDFFQARLSNLPGNVVVDLVLPSTATYRAENVIQRLDLAARVDGKVAFGLVEGVPRLMTFNWAGDRVLYHASENIARLVVQLGDATRLVTVDAQGVPRTMSLRFGPSSATYNADSNMARLTVALVEGRTILLASIANVPMLLTANWGRQGGEQALGIASGGGATSLWLAYSNDGVLGNPWFEQAITPGGPIYVPYADHAYLRSTDSMLRASLMISGLRSLALRQTGGTTIFDASFVGGQTLTLDLLAQQGGQRFKLAGYITNFPSSIHAELGQGFTASLDRNVDIYIVAEAGPAWAVNNLPEPPLTHGLSVRASRSPQAARAKLFLTGLPTYVRADPANNFFEFRNFQPRYPYLVVDAGVDSLAAYVYLASPPNDVALQFRQADKAMSVTYNANRDTGLLYIDVVDRTGAFLGAAMGGRVEVSNIPRSLSIGTGFMGGGMYADYSASATINQIFLGVRQASAGFFQAWAVIRDIPTSWSIRVNDNDSGAPFLSYRAANDNLDIYISVDPSLFGIGLVTKLYASLENLGRQTDFYNQGGGRYRMQSWPDTDRIYLSVSASVPISFYDAKASWQEFYWYYYYANINLRINIDDFVVYTEYLRGLTIKPGLAQRFEGFDVNYLYMGMQALRFDGHAIVFGQLYILIFPVLTVGMAHWFNPSIPIPLAWEVWNDHWYRVFQFSIVFWFICWPEWHWGWSSWVQWHCLSVTVWMDAHPHYHRTYYSWWGGGFALWREESNTQLVFLNPLIPMYINGPTLGIPFWMEWIYMTFAEGGVSFGVSVGWT